MIFNKDTWHYKIWKNSFNGDEFRPETTDLCRYCHRVFWGIAKIIFLVISITLMVALFSWFLFYKALYLNTGITLAGAGILGGMILIIHLYSRWLHGGLLPQEPTTLFGKYAKAGKDRVCPLVEFKE